MGLDSLQEYFGYLWIEEITRHQVIQGAADFLYSHNAGRYLGTGRLLR